MKALILERNLPRFAASRVASIFGSGRGAGLGPLQLLDAETPELPGDEWHTLTPLLSGICGSDLATIDGPYTIAQRDLLLAPWVEVCGMPEGLVVALDGDA